MVVMVAIASSALAKTDQEFIAGYRENIQLLETQINHWMKERTVRCPKQQTAVEKEACNSAFNTLIARHRAEQGINELRIAAFSLNEDRKNAVFRAVTGPMVDRHNQETLDFDAVVKLIFPAPK
jgi:hypothetical protein